MLAFIKRLRAIIKHVCCLSNLGSVPVIRSLSLFYLLDHLGYSSIQTLHAIEDFGFRDDQ
jgi:hypothetical protein